MQSAVLCFWRERVEGLDKQVLPCRLHAVVLERTDGGRVAAEVVRNLLGREASSALGGKRRRERIDDGSGNGLHDAAAQYCADIGLAKLLGCRQA
jgi:hypothetical protein